MTVTDNVELILRSHLKMEGGHVTKNRLCAFEISFDELQAKDRTSTDELACKFYMYEQPNPDVK